MSGHYDIIGDIHGQSDKLHSLLKILGYEKNGTIWRHPYGRIALFLGDYIDRGPNVLGVLETVRSMETSGVAVAIMGNHEFNFICYHTARENGRWLRSHSEKNQRQNDATRNSLGASLLEWIEWMKCLPLALELDGLRLVHACWHQQHLKSLPIVGRRESSWLEEASTKGSEQYQAVRVILNGPEVNLPDGHIYYDQEGTAHSRIRVRWWNRNLEMSLGELAMPKPIGSLFGCFPPFAETSSVINYSRDDPPVFFGHYWLPPNSPKTPLAANVACLDYSAGQHGPLVAYQWDGERDLLSEKFVISPCASQLLSGRI